MLIIEQKNIILKVLQNPMFSYNFYDEKKLEELYQSIDKILIDMEKNDKSNIIDKIQTVLSEGTIEFPCEFKNTNEEVDKTSYGLLCNNGSNSLGFAETTSILLNLNDYESIVTKSKLPDGNEYYVTLVEDENGLIKVVTPERLRFCNQNDYNLLAYQCKLEYNFNDTSIKPIDSIKKNYSILLNQNGELNIENNYVTPQIKGVLKEIISNSISDIYYNLKNNKEKNM